MTILNTLPKYLKYNYEKYGDEKIAMRVKDLGIWQNYSWKDYYYKVKYFSLGIISMGLSPGDKICILGESKPEWIWAELAAQAAGSIPVGIFTDCMANEVKYFMENSEAKLIVVQDQEQVDKVLQIKDELHLLEKAIYWDPTGLWNYDDPILISFDDVVETGKEYDEKHPGIFEANVEQGTGKDICIFCYTSGTTGLPRAAMIQQQALIHVAKTQGITDCYSDNDNYVAFFSPAWIADQTMAVAGAIVWGVTVNFVEKPETIMENIREIGPDILGWGPRQWESVMRAVQSKIIQTSTVKRFLYKLFLPVAYKRADFIAAKANPSFFWKALYTMGHWFVYRNLLDKFGLARVRVARTGGSSISPDMIRYFQAMGVNIQVGYGLSEAALVASHLRDDVQPDTTGPVSMGMESRLSKDSEVLVRGDNLFCGYYKDPEATQKKVLDGWYHTGDFGHVDDDGHLIVMDRMDDLRELRNGYKFSPQYIEIRLRFSPYIKEAIVLGGENRDYVAAIINMDIENVARWAESRRIPYTTFIDLSQKSEVITLIKNEIEKINKRLPEASIISKFANLHREFDADESELTRTRKLRRMFIEEHYKDLIDALYSGVSALPVEATITYRDGRKGTIGTHININSMD